jgi:hypothetical protein
MLVKQCGETYRLKRAVLGELLTANEHSLSHRKLSAQKRGTSLFSPSSPVPCAAKGKASAQFWEEGGLSMLMKLG